MVRIHLSLLFVVLSGEDATTCTALAATAAASAAGVRKARTALDHAGGHDRRREQR